MRDFSVVPHRNRLWLYAICGLALVFLVLPCLIIIPMSFNGSNFLRFPPTELSLRWYAAFFDSPVWTGALMQSFKLASLTVLFATPLGTCVAYGLTRLSQRLATMLRNYFMLPLLVPHIIAAVALFFAFSPLGLTNTLTGLVLAHVLFALPFVFVTVGSGLRSFDVTLELAARSLGASWLTAFLTITVPQIRLSILAAALFAFVTSFDETLAVLFLSSGEQSTLTRQMYVSMRDEISPIVASIASMLVIASIVVLGASQFIGRRHQPA